MDRRPNQPPLVPVDTSALGGLVIHAQTAAQSMAEIAGNITFNNENPSDVEDICPPSSHENTPPPTTTTPSRVKGTDPPCGPYGFGPC